MSSIKPKVMASKVRVSIRSKIVMDNAILKK
jgi:hypothetical protein